MHTQLLHGALLVVFSPPASPAGSLSALHLLSAQRGLGLLRRPPHMTCGELFIIEGAPWGSCSLRAGPARLSPVSYLPLTLPPRTTEKSADGVTLPRWGRPLSLLLEALKSSQQTAPPPQAIQVLSSYGTNSYHFLEVPKGNGPRWACGSIQVLSFRSLQGGCDAWPLGPSPEA